MRVLVRRVNEWDAPTMLKVYEPYIKSNATEDEVQPTIAEFVQRIDKYTYGTGWIISEIDGETGGFCLLTESRPKDVFTNEIKLFVKPGYKLSLIHISEEEAGRVFFPWAYQAEKGSRR